MIELAEFDGPADGKSEPTSHAGPHIRRQGARPPGDHHRPERIAKDVTNCERERSGTPMNEQADRNGAQGQGHESQTNQEPWRHAGRIIRLAIPVRKGRSRRLRLMPN